MTRRENERTVVHTAGTFLTMDDSMPRAEAVAVRDGVFVAVGSLEDVTAAAGPGCIIDRTFDEKVVIAGLIDQHLHPMLAATTLTTEVIAPEDWVMPRRVHRAATTPSGYDERLREAHGRLAEGEWLFSWGYHSLWHGPMSRQRLDALTAGRPTAVWQRSCHEWFLNSAALATIGLEHGDTTGRGLASTQLDWDRGHFWENGWMLILANKLMPLFMTEERFRAGLAQMVEYLHMNGVTAINEPGIYWRNEPWHLYQEMLGGESVPFESTFMVEGRTQPVRGLAPREWVDDALAQVERGRGEKVRVLDRHVKLFCDGAIISQLMQMNDPYLDEAGRPDPHHHGEWMMEPDVLRQVFDVYWDAGWQVHIHVNGDRGLGVLLDIIESAAARTPRHDHRTVIVHFANSTEEQVDRIAALGAVVSANPYYPIGFSGRYSTWGLGPERARNMVRAGSVRRRGIPLSYHSDLPMCPSDPMAMASWGITRRTNEGVVVAPEQCISVHDALRAVTIEAAYSWRREHELGSITPGKFANMTVLGADPYATDPERWRSIPVLGTVFRGVWHAVDPELVPVRLAGVVKETSGALHGGSVGAAHACGCEAAAFVAEHVTRRGWAA